MQTGRATFEGAVTNKLINFYVRRSSALGLPIVEHAYVSPTGKIGPKQLGIYEDSLISGFEKLAKRLHEVGAPAVVQLSHAGGVTNRKVIGAEPVGPSPREKTRMLEVSEIEALADDFALAAQRAVKAGLTGLSFMEHMATCLTSSTRPCLTSVGMSTAVLWRIGCGFPCWWWQRYVNASRASFCSIG